MGGLVDSIFGGGSGKATKKSLALQERMHNDTMALLRPFATTGQNLFNQYGSFLQGGPEAEAAFKSWLDSSDYGFVKERGMDALTSSQAGKGQLRSGATGKGLVDFGQKLGVQYRQNFLNNLLQGGTLGASAANSAASANTSNAQLGTQTYMQGAQMKANAMNQFLNTAVGIAGLF